VHIVHIAVHHIAMGDLSVLVSVWLLSTYLHRAILLSDWR